MFDAQRYAVSKLLRNKSENSTFFTLKKDNVVSYLTILNEQQTDTKRNGSCKTSSVVWLIYVLFALLWIIS